MIPCPIPCFKIWAMCFSPAVKRPPLNAVCGDGMCARRLKHLALSNPRSMKGAPLKNPTWQAMASLGIPQSGDFMIKNINKVI
jgi:hypothetical protein